jgi:hypothetical protein
MDIKAIFYFCETESQFRIFKLITHIKFKILRDPALCPLKNWYTSTGTISQYRNIATGGLPWQFSEYRSILGIENYKKKRYCVISTTAP